MWSLKKIISIFVFKGILPLFCFICILPLQFYYSKKSIFETLSSLNRYPHPLSSFGKWSLSENVQNSLVFPLWEWGRRPAGSSKVKPAQWTTPVQTYVLNFSVFLIIIIIIVFFLKCLFTTKDKVIWPRKHFKAPAPKHCNNSTGFWFSAGGWGGEEVASRQTHNKA